jgi:hypothetical protein
MSTTVLGLTESIVMLLVLLPTRPFELLLISFTTSLYSLLTLLYLLETEDYYLLFLFVLFSF